MGWLDKPLVEVFDAYIRVILPPILVNLPLLRGGLKKLELNPLGFPSTTVL